jgi:hypothetical protein
MEGNNARQADGEPVTDKAGRNMQNRLREPI